MKKLLLIASIFAFVSCTNSRAVTMKLKNIKSGVSYVLRRDSMYQVGDIISGSAGSKWIIVKKD